MYKRWRDVGEAKALVTVIALAAAIGAAGCGGSSNTSAGNSASSATNSASTPSRVTLTFMSLANSPGVEQAWSQLIKAYEQANPNVTIHRTPVAYANYRTRVKLQASAPDAPDLVEGDMGPGGVMASLVTPHLLHPLDSYATQYDWASKFGALGDQLRIAPNGKNVGTGSMYGIPDFAEVLGVFYNKQDLAKLHLRAPSTLAQFQSSLAAAKAAGMTPLMIGGADKFPWSHIYDILADQYGQPDALINWFNGAKGATVVAPGMIKAGQVLQSWFKNGYFENGANGVSDADAMQRFAHGQSLYHVSGPWDTQGGVQGLGQNLGFFLLPPATAGAQPASTGWMGWSVGITAHSKHPAAAAGFLNFLTSSQARDIMLGHYNPPGTPGTTYGPTTNPVVRTIGTDYDEVANKGTLVPYMDVAYPQAAPYDMLANAQAMAAGQMSVQDFLNQSQKGWTTYHGF
jgi:raffinose/stachyose/melibiose transport system substrate-binding protein